MRSTIKLIPTLLSITLLISVSCADLEVPFKDIPFSFYVSQNNDTIGVAMQTEVFTGNIYVDPALAGTQASERFFVQATELNGYSGLLKIDGVPSTDVRSLDAGIHNFEYVSSETGRHKLVLKLQNQAGRVAQDTFACNIKKYETVNFSFAASPSSVQFTGTSSGARFTTLTITSDDTSGSVPYRIYWENITQGGAAWLSISGNEIAQGALISRSQIIGVNVFYSSHNKSNTDPFTVRIRIVDYNGDERVLDFKYYVRS